MYSPWMLLHMTATVAGATPSFASNLERSGQSFYQCFEVPLIVCICRTSSAVLGVLGLDVVAYDSNSAGATPSLASNLDTEDCCRCFKVCIIKFHHVLCSEYLAPMLLHTRTTVAGAVLSVASNLERKEPSCQCFKVRGTELICRPTPCCVRKDYLKFVPPHGRTVSDTALSLAAIQKR